jgi:hypothetical protein
MQMFSMAYATFLLPWLQQVLLAHYQRTLSEDQTLSNAIAFMQ